MYIHYIYEYTMSVSPLYGKMKIYIENVLYVNVYVYVFNGKWYNLCVTPTLR